MTMRHAILTVEGLRYRRGQDRVLDGIELALRRGRVLAILGPNGVGKTTLLRCMTGALSPEAGRIMVDGVAISALSPRQRAMRIAHVPQSLVSVFGHSLREMVLMGRVARHGPFGRPGREDQAATDAAIARVGLAALADRPFDQLSGGERQLSLLARALAQGAPVLLLDEPAAALDLANRRAMLRLLRELAAAGHAIAMTTHHPEDAVLLEAEVLALRGGTVLGAGPARKLLTEDFVGGLYRAPVRVLRGAGGATAITLDLDAAGEPAGYQRRRVHV